jgi:hypothetical protein
MTDKGANRPYRGSPDEEFERMLSDLGAGAVPVDPVFRDGLESHLRRSYRRSSSRQTAALPPARRFAVGIALLVGMLVGASIYGPIERKLGLGTVSAQQVLKKAVQMSDRVEAAIMHIRAASSIRDIYSGQTNEAVVEEWVDLADPLVFCRLIVQPDKAEVARACNGEGTYLFLRNAFRGQPGYLVRMHLTDREMERLRARVLLRQTRIKDTEPYVAKARYIRKETALDNRPVHTITYDMQVDNPWNRKRDQNPERLPANVTMKVDAENYRVLSFVEQTEFNGIWFTTFSREVQQFEMLGQDEINPLAVIEEMMNSEIHVVEIPRTGRSEYQTYMAGMALAGQGEYFVPESELLTGRQLPGIYRKMDKILKKSDGDWQLMSAVRLPGSGYRLHFSRDDGSCLILENRLPYRSLDRSWNAKIDLIGRSWLVETNFGLEGDDGSKGIFSQDISFLHPMGMPIYIRGRNLSQEEMTGFIRSMVVPYDEDEARRALQMPWGDPPILEELPDKSIEMRAARAWRRATLGMAIVPSEDGRGSTVIAVFERGPAAQVGVKEGDRLLYFNGVPIANNRALKNELDKRRFGDRVTLTLERNNELLEVKPTLVRRIYLLNPM